MSIANFSGSSISSTYNRLVQTDGTVFADGTGSIIDLINITSSTAVSASYALSASYAVSASHEIIKEVSSSYADTASYIDPLNQDVIITGSVTSSNLLVTGQFQNYNPDIPDIGIEQVNDARGYGDNYVAEKTLAYCRIGDSAFDEEGAVRIKNNIFQTYVGGEWKDVPTGFRFRQDPDGNYEFEHKPTGFDLWIEVSSGNSDLLGLNGLPIVQNYAVSMGPYPVPLEIDGGTF